MVQLHYFPANANAAPHMLLEEIGVEYDLVLVDRAKNAQKSRAYLKINPNGRIPVLVDDDLIVSEAAAIVLHLVDQNADAGLAPKIGTPERAKFYQWLIFLTNSLQEELMTWQYPERLAGSIRSVWPAPMRRRRTSSSAARNRAPVLSSTSSKIISRLTVPCSSATNSAPSTSISSCSRAGRAR